MPKPIRTGEDVRQEEEYARIPSSESPFASVPTEMSESVSSLRSDSSWQRVQAPVDPPPPPPESTDPTPTGSESQATEAMREADVNSMLDAGLRDQLLDLTQGSEIWGTGQDVRSTVVGGLGFPVRPAPSYQAYGDSPGDSIPSVPQEGDASGFVSLDVEADEDMQQSDGSEAAVSDDDVVGELPGADHLLDEGPTFMERRMSYVKESVPWLLDDRGTCILSTNLTREDGKISEFTIKHYVEHHTDARGPICAMACNIEFQAHQQLNDDAPLSKVDASPVNLRLAHGEDPRGSDGCALNERRGWYADGTVDNVDIAMIICAWGRRWCNNKVNEEEPWEDVTNRARDVEPFLRGWSGAVNADRNYETPWPKLEYGIYMVEVLQPFVDIIKPETRETMTKAQARESWSPCKSFISFWQHRAVNWYLTHFDAKHNVLGKKPDISMSERYLMWVEIVRPHETWENEDKPLEVRHQIMVVQAIVNFIIANTNSGRVAPALAYRPVAWLQCDADGNPPTRTAGASLRSPGWGVGSACLAIYMPVQFLTPAGSIMGFDTHRLCDGRVGDKCESEGIWPATFVPWAEMQICIDHPGDEHGVISLPPMHPRWVLMTIELHGSENRFESQKSPWPSVEVPTESGIRAVRHSVDQTTVRIPSECDILSTLEAGDEPNDIVVEALEQYDPKPWPMTGDLVEWCKRTRAGPFQKRPLAMDLARVDDLFGYTPVSLMIGPTSHRASRYPSPPEAIDQFMGISWAARMYTLVGQKTKDLRRGGSHEQKSKVRTDNFMTLAQTFNTTMPGMKAHLDRNPKCLHPRQPLATLPTLRIRIQGDTYLPIDSIYATYEDVGLEPAQKNTYLTRHILSAGKYFASKHGRDRPGHSWAISHDGTEGFALDKDSVIVLERSKGKDFASMSAYVAHFAQTMYEELKEGRMSILHYVYASVLATRLPIEYLPKSLRDACKAELSRGETLPIYHGEETDPSRLAPHVPLNKAASMASSSVMEKPENVAKIPISMIMQTGLEGGSQVVMIQESLEQMKKVRAYESLRATAMGRIQRHKEAVAEGSTKNRLNDKDLAVCKMQATKPLHPSVLAIDTAVEELNQARDLPIGVGLPQCDGDQKTAVPAEVPVPPPARRVTLDATTDAPTRETRTRQTRRVEMSSSPTTPNAEVNEPVRAQWEASTQRVRPGDEPKERYRRNAGVRGNPRLPFEPVTPWPADGPLLLTSINECSALIRNEVRRLPGGPSIRSRMPPCIVCGKKCVTEAGTALSRVHMMCSVCGRVTCFKCSHVKPGGMSITMQMRHQGHPLYCRFKGCRAKLPFQNENWFTVPVAAIAEMLSASTYETSSGTRGISQRDVIRLAIAFMDQMYPLYGGSFTMRELLDECYHIRPYRIDFDKGEWYYVSSNSVNLNSYTMLEPTHFIKLDDFWRRTPWATCTCDRQQLCYGTLRWPNQLWKPVSMDLPTNHMHNAVITSCGTKPAQPMVWCKECGVCLCTTCARESITTLPRSPHLQLAMGQCVDCTETRGTGRSTFRLIPSMKYDHVARRLRLRPEEDRKKLICMNWSKPVNRRCFPTYYCSFPNCEFVVCTTCIEPLRTDEARRSVLEVEDVVGLDIIGKHKDVGLCPYHLVPMYKWQYDLDINLESCSNEDRYVMNKRGGRDLTQQFFDEVTFAYRPGQPNIVGGVVPESADVATSDKTWINPEYVDVESAAKWPNKEGIVVGGGGDEWRKALEKKQSFGESLPLRRVNPNSEDRMPPLNPATAGKSKSDADAPVAKKAKPASAAPIPAPPSTPKRRHDDVASSTQATKVPATSIDGAARVTGQAATDVLNLLKSDNKKVDRADALRAMFGSDKAVNRDPKPKPPAFVKPPDVAASAGPVSAGPVTATPQIDEAERRRKAEEELQLYLAQLRGSRSLYNGSIRKEFEDERSRRASDEGLSSADDDGSITRSTNPREPFEIDRLNTCRPVCPRYLWPLTPEDRCLGEMVNTVRPRVFDSDHANLVVAYGPGVSYNDAPELRMYFVIHASGSALNAQGEMAMPGQLHSEELSALTFNEADERRLMGAEFVLLERRNLTYHGTEQWHQQAILPYVSIGKPPEKHPFVLPVKQARERNVGHYDVDVDRIAWYLASSRDLRARVLPKLKSLLGDCDSRVLSRMIVHREGIGFHDRTPETGLGIRVQRVIAIVVSIRFDWTTDIVAHIDRNLGTPADPVETFIARYDYERINFADGMPALFQIAWRVLHGYTIPGVLPLRITDALRELADGVLGRRHPRVDIPAGMLFEQ